MHQDLMDFVDCGLRRKHYSIKVAIAEDMSVQQVLKSRKAVKSKTHAVS